MPMTRTQQEKGAAFAALHAGEPFVIPNPWDAGSARVLAALGFKALASTSSGFAFTLGRLDGTVTLDQVIGHVTVLDQPTELPLSADLENGYGPNPASAAGPSPAPPRRARSAARSRIMTAAAAISTICRTRPRGSPRRPKPRTDWASRSC